jgi:hypothetical protein
VSLVSRYLEANGMPTVIIANARDIVEHCGVARLVFTDFPLGSPCGEPFNGDMQRAIVGQAFDLLESATEARTTVTASFTWGAGDDWKGKIFTAEQPFLEGDDHDAWIRQKALYKKLKEEGEA